MISRNGWKIFFVALLVNAIENLALLYFFRIPIGRTAIISAIIFALIFMFLFEKISERFEK